MNFLTFQFEQFGSGSSWSSCDCSESTRFFLTKPFHESSSGIGSEFFVKKCLATPSQRAVRNGSYANGSRVSKVNINLLDYNLFNSGTPN